GSSRLLGVQAASYHDDAVGQGSDPVDLDPDDVARSEGEVGAGDDAGADEQDGAGREVQGEHEPLREVVEITGELARRRGPGERRAAVALDGDPDGPGAGRSGPDGDDLGPERARAAVDLGLGEVQRVVALDRAAAHVV